MHIVFIFFHVYLILFNHIIILQLMATEEMHKNVEKLDEMDALLNNARDELMVSDFVKIV